MKNRGRAACCTAIIGIAVAGCGSSSSNSGLSYSAFANAANKACQTSDTQISSLQSLHPTSLAAAGAALGKVVRAAQNLDSQLSGLHGPTALERARDTYVADGRQLVARLQGAVSSADKNNIAGFRTAFSGFGALILKADRDGQKLGAINCAGSSAG